MNICILSILPVSSFVCLDKQKTTFFLKKNTIMDFCVKIKTHIIKFMRALGDIFSLLVTHFPHLSNGNNNSPHLLSLVSGFRESLAQCLAQSNHLTHGRNNLLFFFFATLCGSWDCSSLTRDQTQAFSS